MKTRRVTGIISRKPQEKQSGKGDARARELEVTKSQVANWIKKAKGKPFMFRHNGALDGHPELINKDAVIGAIDRGFIEPDTGSAYIDAEIDLTHPLGQSISQMIDGGVKFEFSARHDERLPEEDQLMEVSMVFDGARAGSSIVAASTWNEQNRMSAGAGASSSFTGMQAPPGVAGAAQAAAAAAAGQGGALPSVPSIEDQNREQLKRQVEMMPDPTKAIGSALTGVPASTPAAPAAPAAAAEPQTGDEQLDSMLKGLPIEARTKWIDHYTKHLTKLAETQTESQARIAAHETTIKQLTSAIQEADERARRGPTPPQLPVTATAFGAPPAAVDPMAALQAQMAALQAQMQQQTAQTAQQLKAAAEQQELERKTNLLKQLMQRIGQPQTFSGMQTSSGWPAQPAASSTWQAPPPQQWQPAASSTWQAPPPAWQAPAAAAAPPPPQWQAPAASAAPPAWQASAAAQDPMQQMFLLQQQQIAQLQQQLTQQKPAAAAEEKPHVRDPSTGRFISGSAWERKERMSRHFLQVYEDPAFVHGRLLATPAQIEAMRGAKSQPIKLASAIHNERLPTGTKDDMVIFDSPLHRNDDDGGAMAVVMLPETLALIAEVDRSNPGMGYQLHDNDRKKLTIPGRA